MRPPLRFALGLLLCALPARAGAPTDGGASVSVQVSQSGETTIEVKKGELAVRAGGKESRLRTGQGGRASKGQPLRKVSLLAAPAALRPSDGEHVSTLEVALAWAAVPGAKQYRLAVAPDQRFAKPVHDALHGAGPRASLKLPAGTYYWRVVAVDSDGLQSKASAPRRFVIDTTPPRLKAGKPEWR